MEQQLPLAGVVPVARAGDPETSHAAAASVTNSDAVRWTILCLLCQRLGGLGIAIEHSDSLDDDAFVTKHPEIGMPDHAIVLLLTSDDDNTGAHPSPSGVRSRRHELAEAGLLRPVPGHYAVTPGGKRRALMWAPTALGWRLWSRGSRDAVARRTGAWLAAQRSRRTEAARPVTITERVLGDPPVLPS